MRTLKISLLVFILSITISAQEFWHKTNGPYNGATVYDFLLYKDSLIFLATGEGLIKSSDNGNSWTRLNNYKVTCLGVDKLNTLYYGISGHLRRSTDDGSTWTDIVVPGAAIKDFVISFKDTIFVGSWDAWIENQEGLTLSNGVYRSFDYGNTWMLVNNGIQYPGVYEMIILSNNSILVGTSGGGVYKSTNWGDNWSASNWGLPIAGNYIYAESFIEFAPGQVLTGVHMSIYYSSNYGNTWSFRGNGYNNNIATCFEIDEIGTIYAGSDLSDGVYYSTNNGIQWQYLGLGHSIYTIGWDADSQLYAGGSGDGLYRFIVEDSSWVHVYNQGYTLVEVNDLHITSNDNLLASTEWWGVHYSSNNGNIWEKTNYRGYEPNAIETINDSIIIIGQNNFVTVSYDTGRTWHVTGNFDVQSLFYDSTEQIVYLGTRYPCRIYTSNDFGLNWTFLSEFPQINLQQSIIKILVTRNNHTILASYWASAPYAFLFRLYQSTDQGITWQVIYQDYDHAVTSILQDVNSTVYALAYEKLMISEDEGKSWITRISAGRTVLVSDYSGRIYKDNGIGIQCSTDKGINWYPVDNSGLNNWVNDIVINHNDRIFLSTTAGVYYGEADSIVLSTENIEPVKTFYLYQNYPNPFNPVTKIKYSIPQNVRQETGNVSMKIYDVLGREVATLVNELKPAGEYEVEFNAANFPSGIYFYQLNAGDFRETKKMMLLK